MNPNFLYATFNSSTATAARSVRIFEMDSTHGTAVCATEDGKLMTINLGHLKISPAPKTDIVLRTALSKMVESWKQVRDVHWMTTFDPTHRSQGDTINHLMNDIVALLDQ